MITGHDFYIIVTAMVPLYVTMFLAYGSVKWWKIFTPDQCAGINRFVAIFSVPFLSFRFISMNNPYTMNFRFLAADILQKIIMLAVLCLWTKFSKTGTFEWTITIFSLTTLPNTLVVGIPLLRSMYGDFSTPLMVQVVVLQCIIWYTLLLFCFEIRGAKILIMKRFPESGGDIESIKVDSGVVSLDRCDLLDTVVEIRDNGKLHVTLRKSNASLSGAEIYSISSSNIQTPRVSDINRSGFYSIMGFPSNLGLAADLSGLKPQLQQNGCQNKGNRDAHIVARSSSAPIISKPDRLHHASSGKNEAKEIRTLVPDHPQSGKVADAELEVFGEMGGDQDRIKHGLESAVERHHNMVEVPAGGSAKQMPSTGVMTRLIVMMVWRKLIRNPNTYSSILGLIWSLVSFRYRVGLPKIIEDSISLISNGGLGMCMFSIGLFMALQPKIIACGRSKAVLAMIAKFVIGPVVMAIADVIVGLRGNLLQVSIVQATLSAGIVPFVFAKEYNVHPTILSTSVIFGMLITVPISLCYYIILLIKV